MALLTMIVGGSSPGTSLVTSPRLDSMRVPCSASLMTTMTPASLSRTLLASSSRLSSPALNPIGAGTSMPRDRNAVIVASASGRPYASSR